MAENSRRQPVDEPAERGDEVEVAAASAAAVRRTLRSLSLTLARHTDAVALSRAASALEHA